MAQLVNMITKFDADDLNLISLAKEYSSERKARKLFEAMRWPGGKPICPHCGFDEIYKLVSKKESRTKLRAGVYCCAACRKPFTATVGTVFESSHIPLSKILMAIFILCSSKKINQRIAIVADAENNLPHGMVFRNAL